MEYIRKKMIKHYREQDSQKIAEYLEIIKDILDDNCKLEKQAVLKLNNLYKLVIGVLKIFNAEKSL